MAEGLNSLICLSVVSVLQVVACLGLAFRLGRVVLAYLPFYFSSLSFE